MKINDIVAALPWVNVIAWLWAWALRVMPFDALSIGSFLVLLLIAVFSSMFAMTRSATPQPGEKFRHER